MLESPIQRQILRKAIESPLFSTDVLSVAPLSIFGDDEIYKELATIIKRYYQTNRDQLTEEALLTLTEDKLDRMKKPAEEQQAYFNRIHELYEVANSGDDEIIDEKIEKYIRKHMWVDLLKKAAMNLDNEQFMEKVADEWRNIMMLDISGKQQEIINILDDTEYKRQALSTLYQNIISTGFRSIDNLNGGGLAKGELGIIVAASGTGKCVIGDTMIYTEKGIIDIQDVPKYFDVDSENRLNAFVASYTQNGEYVPRDTSHWYNLGKSKTLRVTTKSGYSVEGTPEHPLLVMNRKGNLEYVELQDLKQGDYLALAKPNMWSDVNQISEEEAYMMALLVADGYVAQDSGLVSFSNSEKVLVDYYKKQAEKLWGIANMRRVPKGIGKSVSHAFNNTKVKKVLESKGLKLVKAADKEIPFTVLQSTKPVVRRFIQGMFDTKGSLYRGTLELTTVSKRLAEQLQVVLLNFGIRAALRSKKVKEYEQNNYYRLSITGLALKQFHKEIGFRFNEKYQQRLEEVIKVESNTNVEVFPYQGKRLRRIKDIHFKGKEFWDGHTQKLGEKRLNGVFYNHRNPSKETIEYILSYTTYDDADTLFLKNITENMLFEPIETITESEAVVFDFTVPETHSFVANGIISHNTLMLTNLATNYTKLKYNVLFIALEELENRMILKFEQSMLRQNKSAILTGGMLNNAHFDKLEGFIKQNRDQFGNLFFARYSPNTITPAKVEQLISDVVLREGVNLDVVIIDYPELLRNPKATGDVSEDGGRLFEEMRRIAQDYNVVMWTAAQMNRTAYSAQIRTAEHMEGSHRKKNAAELVLTVNQTQEEYNAGFIRLYADKVRNPPEGPFDRMIGLRVVGSAQTVRDYRTKEEQKEHQAIIEASDSAAEAAFKRRRKEKMDNAPAPDYASEINNSIHRLRGDV